MVWMRMKRKWYSKGLVRFWDCCIAIETWFHVGSIVIEITLGDVTSPGDRTRLCFKGILKAFI
jgi:hypothetical protein